MVQHLYCELQKWPIYPEVVFSTAKRFFESVDADLADLPAGTIPVITHELNFEFAGCYTLQSLIKHANRLGEHPVLVVGEIDEDRLCL